MDDFKYEILVILKDLEKKSDQRLAHLRELVDQRAERARSRVVDADELEERLGQISPRQSKPSSRVTSFSATPVNDDEEEAYQALVADGGRPSHTIGVDMLHQPAEAAAIISLWHHITPQGTIFHTQRWTWNEFREFQDRVRAFHIPRDRFHEYENIVQGSGKDLGYKCGLTVYQDKHKQNRLEDWNEFRAFHYRRLEKSKVAWNKEIAEAELDVESAEKSVHAAEESGQSMEDPQGRAALFEKAPKEVRSAQGNLAHASGSGETSRLDKLREKVRQAKSHIASVQLRTTKWEFFLKWIDDQYPAVGAECGHTVEVGVEDPNQILRGRCSSTSQKLPPAPRQRGHPHCQTILGPFSSGVSKRSKGKSVPRAQEPSTPFVTQPPTSTRVPVKTRSGRESRLPKRFYLG